MRRFVAGSLDWLKVVYCGVRPFSPEGGYLLEADAIAL